MPCSTVDIDNIHVNVPSILDDCFKYILNEGLVEGIFRISGSVRRIRAVADDYSQYREWLFNLTKKPLPHDVCGVIKKYLTQYLMAMNNLFSQSLLAQIRRLHNTHRRTSSDASMDSFKSAVTSLNTSTPVSVLDADADHLSFSNFLLDETESLLDRLAHLLVTRNLSSKNLFFIYLVWRLKQLSEHKAVTKMSAENASIIFQPYIFDTTNLVDLKFFQNLLCFLVENFDLFLEKFTCYRSLLDGYEELEVDNLSITSYESNQVSPTTVYSSSSDSHKKQNEVDAKRKSSISQRFSSFMDSYNAPANRSKRFSMNFSNGSSRPSPDRSRSVEHFRPSSPISKNKSKTESGSDHENYVDKFPQRSSERLTIPTSNEASRASPSSNQEIRSQLTPQDTPRGSPKRSETKSSHKRRSFIDFFTKTPSSTSLSHKKADSGRSSPASSSTVSPIDGKVNKSYGHLSTEKVNQTGENQKLGEMRRLLSRNVSLRRGRK